MNKKNTFLLAALIALSTQAFGNGTEGGGGGDAVILPDGDVVLADVFLDRNQPQPDNMPRRISLNPKLLLQVGIYKEFLSKHLDRVQMFGNRRGYYARHTEVEDLVQELSKRDSKLVFYSVKDTQELNTYCASGGNKAYVLPSGAQVTQVACTAGSEVFLVEPIFRKMSLLQQALLLIHERMTTLRDQHGGKNYGAIAGVTAGLGEILKQAYLQQEGQLAKLTANEETRIRNFYEALMEVEYRNSEIPRDALDWVVHPNGGGIIRKGAEVDPSAFIGVLTYVGPKSTVGANSEIVGSTINGEAEIEASVVIKNSIFDGTVKLGSGTVVSKSSLINGRYIFGNESKIVKTDMSEVYLTTGDRFSAKSSTIKEIGSPSTSVRLTHDQSISNGHLTKAFVETYVPTGTKLAYPSRLVVPKTLTKCAKNKVSPECFVQDESEDKFSSTESHPGVNFVLTQDVERMRWSNIWGDVRRTQRLRSWSLDFSINEAVVVIDESKQLPYTILDQKLAQAGLQRIFDLRFVKTNKNHAAYSEKIAESLRAVGGVVSSSEHGIRIELKIRP